MSFWGQSPDPPNREWSASDTQLVEQARAGNEASFEMLYKRYVYRLYLFLVRLTGNDDVGCELTQETFLKAWQSLSTLREASAFLGWLYRIARNRAYDYQRSTRSNLEDSYDERVQDLEGMSVADPGDQFEAKQSLELALARVEIKCRACFILYHLEGYSKEQIAALLEIKKSSVSTYISNALRELRTFYASNVEDALSREGRTDRE